jgi:MtN3 and saliva related transmembrane protein
MLGQIFAVLFGFSLFVNAFIFVPQALTIWRTKTAAGVSVLTFAGFNVMQAIGAVHGILVHDLALTLGMAASLFTCGTVTILALLSTEKARGTSS